jgi:hypothetical protein
MLGDRVSKRSRLLFVRSRPKARHDVKLHLCHAVRGFLRRRHKVAGPGYRRFPITDMFGKLGVLAPDVSPVSVLRMP